MKPTSSNPTTRRTLRGLLASTLLGLCVFAGTIAGTAQPAQAATVVAGCFLMPDGHIPNYPLTVNLMVWTGFGWNTINSRVTTNGCVVIPMTLGYENHWAILYVNDHNFGGSLVGWTDYAEPGYVSDFVGWGYLQIRCGGLVNTCAR